MDPANVFGFVIFVLIIAAIASWARKKSAPPASKCQHQEGCSCRKNSD